jgi:hypothetical protein
MLEAYFVEHRDAGRAAARLHNEQPWAYHKGHLKRAVEITVGNQLEYGSVEDAPRTGPHYKVGQHSIQRLCPLAALVLLAVHTKPKTHRLHGTPRRQAAKPPSRRSVHPRVHLRACCRAMHVLI